MCVLMCNFVLYFVCVILCIFVFLCDILLPTGIINDDDDDYYYCCHKSRTATVAGLMTAITLSCHACTDKMIL